MNNTELKIHIASKHTFKNKLRGGDIIYTILFIDIIRFRLIFTKWKGGKRKKFVRNNFENYGIACDQMIKNLRRKF